MPNPVSRRDGRRSAVLAVATGGVLVGHRLAYAIAVPHELGTAPSADAHGYLWLANDLALALAVAGVALLFLGRLTRPGTRAPRVVDTAVRLAGFQVGAFVAMEVMERAWAGAPMLDLVRLLPAGVILQAVVAVLGALLVAWLLRAADRVRDVLATAPELARRALAPPLGDGTAPAIRPALRVAGIRGPPLSP